ncbi:MAG: bifunctional DNA-formamidopyrimidine glycosylase/DNA-(apurinic or apyrimidinic site) lyase [Betaproteobacteria bacterium]
MPELPEVETTRRGIAPHAVGQVIVGVDVHDGRLRWQVPATLPETLAGRTVIQLDRRSKYLLFRCEAPAGEPDSDRAGTLLVHLGMTGSLRWYSGAASIPARRAHDHIDLRFEDGSVLRYHDPRRFGAVLWLADPASAHPLLASLGPEPFDAKFDAPYLHRALRSRSAAIKLALMDNHVVVGVGNIYANEALFRAGIRPTRSANRISERRLGLLVDAVRATLSAAIAKGGSTLRDYVDSSGEPGYFQLDYFAYGRGGLPCRICASPLRLIRQGGRATTFCYVCQT